MARGGGGDGSDDDESAPLVSPEKGSGSSTEQQSLYQRRRDQEEEPVDCCREVVDLLRLAVPIFVARISSTAKAITDTALLGHIDADSRFLLASAMSDMWTQSTGVFMNGRVLGTFCSQAFGAGNKQLAGTHSRKCTSYQCTSMNSDEVYISFAGAGIWLQVSLVVVTLIAIPVAVLWGSTHWVLHSLLGQPEEISSDAAYYSMVM